MGDEEFDALVIAAHELQIGNFMDKENTPALAQRLKRLVNSKRKADEKCEAQS